VSFLALVYGILGGWIQEATAVEPHKLVADGVSAYALASPAAYLLMFIQN
jgi:hypothetical protein